MATKKNQDPNAPATDKPKRTRSKPKDQAEPVKPTPAEIPEDEVVERPEDEAAVGEILRDTNEPAEEPVEDAEDTEDTEDAEDAEDAEDTEDAEDAEPTEGEVAAVRAELMAMDRRGLGQMYRKAVRRKLRPSMSQGKAVEVILRQLSRQR